MSRHVSSCHATVVEALCEELKLVESLSSTCDFWEHTATNVTYFAVTIHYLSGPMMKSRVIATCKTDNHTSATTQAAFDEIMERFGISEKVGSTFAQPLLGPYSPIN